MIKKTMQFLKEKTTEKLVEIALEKVLQAAWAFALGNLLPPIKFVLMGDPNLLCLYLLLVLPGEMSSLPDLLYRLIEFLRSLL